MVKEGRGAVEVKLATGRHLSKERRRREVELMHSRGIQSREGRVEELKVRRTGLKRERREKHVSSTWTESDSCVRLKWMVRDLG